MVAAPGQDLTVAATDTILVLTADQRDDILARGGSGDWVLNTDKACRHRYLVCCRKSRWDNKAEGIPDRAAFLIGVIKGISKSERPSERAGQFRYHIELSRYAELEMPGVWDRTWRNPVGYGSLAKIGIDPHALTFKAVKSKPARAMPSGAAPAAPQRLTIAEAKKALAESFGVRPEDIEINIRG